jgi:SAM-dependent methyltransferase
MGADQNPLTNPASWDSAADDYLAEVVPHFERYAADVLRLAAPARDARIIDVACGPGTLAILAARAVAEVCAVDFSPRMVGFARRRAEQAGVCNVSVRVADGSALPWPDHRFDAGFSMFGVFLFSDRARGLAELRRVVRPAGHVVLSSWVAAERPLIIKLVRKALQKHIPGLPDVEQSPLGAPDEIRAELGAAGLKDLRIERIVHPLHFDSLDAAWASMRRSLAPVILLRKQMGLAAFEPIETDVQTLLERELGRGPQAVEMPAWLSRATA